MSASLKKIKQYLDYFLKTKKIWTRPRKSSVLIFDDHRKDLIEPYLLKWVPEVLHVRGENLNVWAFVKALFKSGNKSEAYMDSYIELVNPKMIITVIDNTITFPRLKKRHKNIQTVFVQNGFRGYWDDIFELLSHLPAKEINALAVDVMCTFGSSISSEYKKYYKGETLEIGSIKNNSIPIKKGEKNGIIYISQWHEAGFIFDGKVISQKEFFEDTDSCILKFLDKYSHEVGKKLQIVLRHNALGPSRDKEIKYFNSILDNNAQFYKSTGSSPAYQAIDEAELTVTVDTTVGYESIIRKNKTAILSIRSDILKLHGFTFGWPKDYGNKGPFFTNLADEDIFKEIIDSILSLSAEEWDSVINSFPMEELINLDIGNNKFISYLNKTLS
jgi:surface carbohydrate biosynthesis protein